MTSSLSRRIFLTLAGGFVAMPQIVLAKEETPPMLDHILLGVSDLDAGIAFVEKMSGIRAAAGGSHPGAGTRNALLALGTERYLEIIAPDPQQSSAPDAVHAGLAELRAPKLIGWAVHTHDIAAAAARLSKEGIAADGPLDGSRKRPDGVMLHWHTLRLRDDAEGTLPFFIEWGAETAHPSKDAPSGCRLMSFAVAGPHPEQLREAFRRMGVDVPVETASAPTLRARIAGAHGGFTLT
jgi:catechol 2,3-dioxygenase-like lactoylglutathione lyase family enzyme